jgi:hypothetical protein
VSASHCVVSVSVTVPLLEDEVSMRQVTFRVIRFSPVSIIPPTLHTHFHVHVSVTENISGRRLGTLNPFQEIGKRCVGKFCNFCCDLQRSVHSQNYFVLSVYIYIYTHTF